MTVKEWNVATLITVIVKHMQFVAMESFELLHENPMDVVQITENNARLDAFIVAPATTEALSAFTQPINSSLRAWNIPKVPKKPMTTEKVKELSLATTFQKA